ncbi:hypothetical protein AJ80_01549 [Polytolypa hystricis UAMH7299]|uniref:Uncharacterized protein n=1 Tax=Polytolypa hystricis (strain UAMH7299) TaxID=1447883 RepID=A0A2B7YRY0_POLH7|nr:hypothetical protein AJ80_01549 [Polytolypa hystricis UAMH7299]
MLGLKTSLFIPVWGAICSILTCEFRKTHKLIECGELLRIVLSTVRSAWSLVDQWDKAGLGPGNLKRLLRDLKNSRDPQVMSIYKDIEQLIVLSASRSSTIAQFIGTRLKPSTSEAR